MSRRLEYMLSVFGAALTRADYAALPGAVGAGIGDEDEGHARIGGG